MRTPRFLRNPDSLMKLGIIFVVAGTAATAVGTVIAKKEIDKAKPEIEEIKTKAIEEQVEVEDKKEISKFDQTRALGIACIKLGGKVALSYVPAAALTTLGILGLTKSYKILKTRNIALTSALTATTAAFNAYRERVIADQGEEKDLEYRYGAKVQTIEEVDPETGKTKKVKELVMDSANDDDAMIIFDESCSEWDVSADYCELLLEQSQNTLTTLIQAETMPTLNDFFDMIGHKHTEQGAVTGWLPEGLGGDGYCDLRWKKVKVLDEYNHPTHRYIINPNTNGAAEYLAGLDK